MSDIVIAPAARIDRARLTALTGKGTHSVLYLGTSYSHYMSVREALPAGWTMIEPGALLNAAADRMRDFFVNLDSHVWPKDKDRTAWDATRLGERGPLASPLMLNLSRLAMFVDVTARPGRHLVIGDDVTQCRLWAEEAQRRGHTVAWLGAVFEPLRALTRLLASVRRRAAIVRRFGSRKWALARARRRHPLPLDALRAADVMVTIWGRTNTFPEGSLENEANYGALPKLLRQAGYSPAYLVYPLYTLPFGEVLANAMQASDPVVFIEDLISWRSILTSAFVGLGIPAHLQPASVLGFDAGGVLRAEAERDRESAAMSEAWLLRDVGARLSALGVAPEFLLHLYEAQPWEKMLARGFRDHLPRTKIVGVQHSPFAYTYISFFPSARSIVERATVDLILTSGPNYARWFSEAGVPDDQVGVVGAIRYDGVAAGPSEPSSSILCCTGIDLDEAIELASKAAVATRGLGRRLVINFHPVTDETFRSTLRAEVKRAAGAHADHIVFSTATIRELLSEVGTVLYTTSAACFEAVQAGRAAIYVGRDLQLDYDKLPDPIAQRCRSVGELQDLLRQSNLGRLRAQSPEALRPWLGRVVDAGSLAAMLKARPATESRKQATLRGVG